MKFVNRVEAKEYLKPNPQHPSDTQVNLGKVLLRQFRGLFNPGFGNAVDRLDLLLIVHPEGKHFIAIQQANNLHLRINKPE